MTGSAGDRTRPGDYRDRLLGVLFGDRRGFALFLGSVCFLVVVTRVGIFITDTFTTANAFVALTRGQLAIEAPSYGPSLNTPGMAEIDGRYYGRNYGQLVASLPAYVLIRGVDLVADLRVAVAGVWSLVVVALSVQVGHLLGQREPFALGGAVLALAAFAGNVAVATPLSPVLRHVLAMQATALVAGAFVAVVVYRLVALLSDPRAGLVAGTVVVLGTPVGFWAPIPKRHVFTTLAVVTVVYALAASRGEGGVDGHRRSGTVAHAGAYATVGLFAWVHAPEALVLFVSLVVADVATAGRIDARRAGVVAGAFALSLVPFLITNALITGDPLVPPRLLRELGGLWTAGPWLPGTAGSQPPGTAGPIAAGLSSGVAAVAIPVVDELLSVAGTFAGLVWSGVVTFVTRPDQVFDVFVRSGYVEGSPGRTGQAINLAVVESAPVLAAVAALPVAGAIWLRGIRGQAGDRPGIRGRLDSPAGAAAVLIGVFTVLFTLLYVARLPVYAQVTVRYLLPVYALGVIATVRLTPVGRAVTAHARTFAWSAAAGTLLGGQVLTVVVVGLEMAVGEAFQFHALLGLAVGTVLLAWSLAGTRSERLDRAGAAVAGLTVATAAVFTLAVVVVYAPEIGRYPEGGEQALGIVRVVSESLARV